MLSLECCRKISLCQASFWAVQKRSSNSHFSNNQTHRALRWHAWICPNSVWETRSTERAGPFAVAHWCCSRMFFKKYFNNFSYHSVHYYILFWGVSLHFLLHFGLLLMDFLTLQVRHGLEEFLFKLLILGCLSDSKGTIWRRNAAHLVAIEVLQPGQKSKTQMKVECFFFSVLLTFCSLSHN